MKTRSIFITLALTINSSISFGQVNFTEVSTTPFINVQFGEVAFSDIDNDNDQDLILGGIDVLSNGITHTYINDGNGNYSLKPNLSLKQLKMLSIAISDIDNDLDPDLLITGIDNLNQRHAILYTNDGFGNFTEKIGTPFIPVIGPVRFVDIDNDNDSDVLISGHNGTTYTSNLYVNDGLGNFTLKQNCNILGIGNCDIAFADIDNDSDFDLIITGLYTPSLGTTKLYINDGLGNFTEKTAVPFEDARGGSIEFIDVDNDNDFDVLLSGMNSTALFTRLYLNNGSGNFTLSPNNTFLGIWEGDIKSADVDNDNDQDILITGRNGNLYIAKMYLNNGSGSFSLSPNSNFEGVWGGSIDFTDINGDNDQDLIITGRDINQFSSTKLYKNNLLTGIQNNVKNTTSNVYPNPSTGMVTIDINKHEEVTVNVTNLTGQIIYHQENINSPTFQFELNAKAGIYLIEVISENEKQQFKLVKH